MLNISLAFQFSMGDESSIIKVLNNNRIISELSIIVIKQSKDTNFSPRDYHSNDQEKKKILELMKINLRFLEVPFGIITNNHN